MNAPVDAAQARVTWPLHASAIAGGVSIVLGAAVLYAMWFSVVSVVMPVPGLPPILPHTAEWFVLLGTSLLLLRPARCSATRRRVAQALAFVVFVFAGSGLAEYAFNVRLPFDRGLSVLPFNAATALSMGRSAPG